VATAIKKPSKIGSTMVRLNRPPVTTFRGVRFSLKFFVDLLYETGPQTADLLYLGRTFGVKKLTKNSKFLLQLVFELQVASFRGNCTSGFKFGRTVTVFKLLSVTLPHLYLNKFPPGVIFYSMTDRCCHLLGLFYSIFRTEKEQF
jgi:hypothetical protein